MKKKIIAITLSVFVMTLIGCGVKKETNNDIDKEVSLTQIIKDYYPIKDNVKYIYEGKGNEYASYEVYIDYTDEYKIQQRINNGGTQIVKIIDIDNGRVTQLSISGETYYRENLFEKEADKLEVILMEPLIIGTTWVSEDSSVSTITGISIDVITPSGSYKAIEVATEKDGSKTINYYAKNIGLVKSISIYGEEEISSTLSKIENDVPLVQNINFYYPNFDNNKIYYKSKALSFKTNDITKDILLFSYKETPNDVDTVFTKNVSINNLQLGTDGIIYLDLNRDFLDEMSKDILRESSILQSIANTFCQYYNTNKLILTIDNEPYKSDRIEMQTGEYLTANYDNNILIK